ncbi:MAG: hypothetical protein LBT40_00450 [Deltaproteobacteria bacterium]|nr:hypothetical protein [Deltaproteobacteria bacterium]
MLGQDFGGGGGGSGYEFFGKSRSRGRSSRRGDDWGTARRPTKGEDLEYCLRMSFKDAALGTKVNINVDVPRKCPVCGGVGYLVAGGGMRSCPECGGEKQVMTARELSATIPAGAVDGQRLRIRGNGGPGDNGGPAGDLYLSVKVEPDPDFRRVKNDIHLEKRISLYTAVLGGQAEVKTLSGRSSIKVPAGTQNGGRVRLKGLGIAPARGKAGDLIVTFKVMLPLKLDDEARGLFERLSELAPVNGLEPGD